MSAFEIKSIFQYIYKDNSLNNKRPLIITLTGSGDLSSTINNVVDFIGLASSEYSDLQFTLSSCYYSETVINKLKSIPETIHIRCLQLTYIASDVNKVFSLIPNLVNSDYNVEGMIMKVNQLVTSKSNISSLRINYVMIKDINDTATDFYEFIKLIAPYRENLVIRISKMNETMMSQKHKLLPPEGDSLGELKILLISKQYDAYIFFSEHNDNMSCGQLLSEGFRSSNY